MQTIFGVANEITIRDIQRIRKVPWTQRYARWWMTFVLLLSDLVALFTAGFCGIGLRAAMGEGFKMPDHYIRMAPLLLVFIGVYAWRGLYPAVGLSPVVELRRVTISTSVVFLLVTAFTFWSRSAGIYSRLAFAFSWFFALILVPLTRWLSRAIAVRLEIWGEPAAVVGYGDQGKRIVEFSLKNVHFGIKPAFVIDGFGSSQAVGYPIPRLRIDNEDALRTPMKSAGVRTGILIISEIPENLQKAFMNRQIFDFQRIILIADLQWIGSLGVTPYNLEGLLGLEVRHNLLNAWDQLIKRCFDIVLGLIAGTCALPFFVLLSVLIKLDSGGRALYSQERIGRGGRKFNLWKFRTMITDADQVLVDYLETHPLAKKEWETTHKLKEDPRVTRMGRFLRKTSLDELPQIWNVLKGEMSIVGPRPIVDEETWHYRNCFRLYKSVLPGITGFWQVSGRNDVGYEFRVRLDEYYVRNWSIWLDIYIMLRTVWVVIRGDGAY
jgi:Undecaprenyl-phosphate galactose phosphotransferase WbaP